MATATFAWTPAIGASSQEVYYGKESLVTGFPGSGTGWTAHTDNPLPPATSSITVNSLDENIKYRFLVRSICSGDDPGPFVEGDNIFWKCSTFNVLAPSSGLVTWTLTFDASVTSLGSEITKTIVTLLGKNRNNGATQTKEIVINSPLSGTITDGFTGVEGDIDWTIFYSYYKGDQPIFTCGKQTFSTTVGGSQYMTVQNNTTDGVLSQLYIDDTSVSSRLLISGDSYEHNITSLIGSNPHRLGINMSGYPNGTQLLFRHIRAGLLQQVYVFTYNGSNSYLSASLIDLQNGDTLEIMNTSAQRFIPLQTVVTKTSSPSNGYTIKLESDLVHASSVTYTVTFSSFDYGTGKSEVKTDTVTIAAGQKISDTKFISSSLSTLSYTDSQVSGICISPGSGTVLVAQRLICL